MRVGGGGPDTKAFTKSGGLMNGMASCPYIDFLVLIAVDAVSLSPIKAKRYMLVNQKNTTARSQ